MQISDNEIFSYLTQNQLHLAVISMHKNAFSKDKHYSYDLLKYADQLRNNFSEQNMLDVITAVCRSVIVIHRVFTSDQ